MKMRVIGARGSERSASDDHGAAGRAKKSREFGGKGGGSDGDANGDCRSNSDKKQ